MNDFEKMIFVAALAALGYFLYNHKQENTAVAGVITQDTDMQAPWYMVYNIPASMNAGNVISPTAPQNSVGQENANGSSNSCILCTMFQGVNL